MCATTVRKKLIDKSQMVSLLLSGVHLSSAGMVLSVSARQQCLTASQLHLPELANAWHQVGFTKLYIEYILVESTTLKIEKRCLCVVAYT